MKKTNFQKMMQAFGFGMSAALLLGAVLFINSCKKETTNVQDPQVSLDEASEAMTEHIMQFTTRMETLRDNPSLKSGGELLPIAPTVLDWEAAINFTYCYSNLELSGMRSFDTIIDLPVVQGDKITAANVSAKYYNNILESVQDLYFKADFEEKELVSVDLEPVNGGNSLLIKVLVGNTIVPSYPVYDWYYGEFEGVCETNEYATELDAATVIAIEVRNHFYTAPPQGCRWYFTNIITYEDNTPTDYPNPEDDVIDNQYDYLLYYANEAVGNLTEEVRCVEHATEFQFYKQNYISLTQAYLDDAPIFIEGRMKYQTSVYEGKDISFNFEHYLQHELTTKIGRRFKVCNATNHQHIDEY